jgi:hypothetical protein
VNIWSIASQALDSSPTVVAPHQLLTVSLQLFAESRGAHSKK